MGGKNREGEKINQTLVVRLVDLRSRERELVRWPCFTLATNGLPEGKWISGLCCLS